jgi:hypothetical protein
MRATDPETRYATARQFREFIEADQVLDEIIAGEPSAMARQYAIEEKSAIRHDVARQKRQDEREAKRAERDAKRAKDAKDGKPAWFWKGVL